MSPVRSQVLATGGSLWSRADGNYNFDPTPAAAVVIPIAVLILLLAGGAVVSVFRYCRRKNERSQLTSAKSSTPKSSRKLVPNWLGDWLGRYRPRPSDNADSQKSDFDIFDNTRKPEATGQRVDEEEGDSDSITLRPISVYIPTYPSMTYDPYDRYPAISGTRPDIRPKVMGVSFR